MKPLQFVKFLSSFPFCHFKLSEFVSNKAPTAIKQNNGKKRITFKAGEEQEVCSLHTAIRHTKGIPHYN